MGVAIDSLQKHVEEFREKLINKYSDSLKQTDKSNIHYKLQYIAQCYLVSISGMPIHLLLFWAASLVNIWKNI